MSDKNQQPKFSEKAVDNLIASYDRQPDQKQMTALNEMMKRELLKQKIRGQMKESADEHEQDSGQSM